jgi:thiol:disulfide interchange protein DsbC
MISPLPRVASLFVATLMAAILGSLSLPADANDAIRAVLSKRYPDLKIDSIRKTDFGGLFEVVLDGPGGKEIIYTGDKANFVLAGGQIIDDKKDNVTERRMRQLTAIKWGDLPLQNAIKMVRGNGSRNIAVFADPYCSFCKRFEADLLRVDNVTVYTFLLPIIRPESMPISKKVWCAADRGKAWIDLMTKDTPPANEGKCDTPLDSVLAFGQKHKINGTPTLIFENGERQAAALNTQQIEEALNNAEKK